MGEPQQVLEQRGKGDQHIALHLVAKGSGFNGLLETPLSAARGISTALEDVAQRGCLNREGLVPISGYRDARSIGIRFGRQQKVQECVLSPV
jgi:hypothetical protein